MCSITASGKRYTYSRTVHQALRMGIPSMGTRPMHVYSAPNRMPSWNSRHTKNLRMRQRVKTRTVSG